MSDRPRLLFVTGRLAEFALREVLGHLAPRAGFEAEVAVLPISVAALMPPRWVARHLVVPENVDRVILPGYCQGDLTPVQEVARGRAVELGPFDLRDLPGYFDLKRERPAGYGTYNIEIIAEINHAPTLEFGELLARADGYLRDGADVIDIGCNPGGGWTGVGDAVSALRDAGHRVSIDSFDRNEVERAVAAGAELVLSVNATNREYAPDWGVEVVAIPELAEGMTGLDETIEFLIARNVKFRIDPVLEPIGFGFAASLGRYLDARSRYPDLEVMMGVGNLTELTDVDSAGVNVLLAGICEELGIRSVLTTEVINWARSSVRELDLARRLVAYAVRQRALPKHIEPKLVALRDTRVTPFGAEALAEFARRVKDPNWRIFAERGGITAFRQGKYLEGDDPFTLFAQMDVNDPAHAFYLGYEMAKAVTALTLDKNYRQDQALDWGFLTRPERSHRAKGSDANEGQS